MTRQGDIRNSENEGRLSPPQNPSPGSARNNSTVNFFFFKSTFSRNGSENPGEMLLPRAPQRIWCERGERE